MRLVNLTPHRINILDLGGNAQVGSIDPSGQVARTAATFVADKEVAGFPTCRASYGEVTGLPAPEEGVGYVVSGLVAAHPTVAGRGDVFAPGDLVRGADGQPVGCKGLKRA
ncbi:MAG: hypothetical protein WC764_02165 [Candidatus Paceibacterota bacterium]|jgi:hypothetical protein